MGEASVLALHSLLKTIVDADTQTLSFNDSNTLMDYTSGKIGKLTLTGDVEILTLSNVPEGKEGAIEIMQDDLGGYGINAIDHAELTVVYISGNAPSSQYINTEGGVKTVISYLRIGNTLYIAYASTDIQTQLDSKLPINADINEQEGTTYTLQESDNGKIITCNNESAIEVTVPGGLGKGFNCMVMQIGDGQVSFAESSTTINNRNSHTKTAGKYAAVTLLAYAADTFLLQGDTEL